MERGFSDHDGVVGRGTEEVLDLDGPSGDDEGSGGRAVGPHHLQQWWRGPRGVALLVVVVIALTAALTGWQQRQVYTTKLADERATGALRAEFVAVRAVGEAPPAAAPTPVDVTIDLVNAGDVGLTVALTAVDSGSAGGSAGGSAVQLSDPPEPVEVAPGGLVSLVASAMVDCSAVDTNQSDEATGGVEVAVAIPGAERTLSLTTSGSSTTIADQVSLVCRPGLFSTVEVAGAALQQDGRLEVRLYNPGTADRRISASGQAAAGVTAEPALPILVPAGATTAVTLSLEPDCALADRLSGQVLELVTDQVDGPGAVALPTSLESQTITAWVARRTALDCV